MTIRPSLAAVRGPRSTPRPTKPRAKRWPQRSDDRDGRRSLATEGLRGVRGRPYLPLLVLFGYAELVYQAPTSLAGIVFAGGPFTGIADAVSVVMLVWFALVVHRAITLHYGVSGDQALAIFLIGGLAFYLLPLILIAVLLVAIVVAAGILQYFQTCAGCGPSCGAVARGAFPVP